MQTKSEIIRDMKEIILNINKKIETWAGPATNREYYGGAILGATVAKVEIIRWLEQLEGAQD